MTPEERTPDEWQTLLGVRIADPDGWRGSDRRWHEPITREEFEFRAARSTTVDQAAEDAHTRRAPSDAERRAARARFMTGPGARVPLTEDPPVRTHGVEMVDRDRAVVELGRTLQQMRVEVPVGVSRHMIEVREDAASLIRDHLTAALSGYVLADHLADDTYQAAVPVEYPATTWQMFKHTHAGSWWLSWLVSRRPVRMRVERPVLTVKVGRYLTYPEATLRVPHVGSARVMELVSQDVTR